MSEMALIVTRILPEIPPTEPHSIDIFWVDLKSKIATILKTHFDRLYLLLVLPTATMKQILLYYYFISWSTV